MKIYNNTYYNNTPSFGKFIKITGNTHSVKTFRAELIHKTDKYMTLCVKKDKHKSILYLFSGKHFDEFIDIGTNMHFGTFRRNVEKYMKTKPQKLGLKKAEKKLL